MWGEVWVDRGGFGGEALASESARRMILRYAQNDKGTAEAKIVLIMGFPEGILLAMVRSLQYN